MKAVPSVLLYLGKCTARFCSNRVYTLSNSAMGEVALDKCIYVFPGIVNRVCLTMKTVYLFVRLVGRARKLDIGFIHCPMLNWISLNTV